MNPQRWLTLATAHTAQFDALSTELLQHQAAEPFEPSSDAADLLLRMQLKAEFLAARIRHVAHTQKLLRQMFELQQTMLKHLSRAPDAVRAQAEQMVGA